MIRGIKTHNGRSLPRTLRVTDHDNLLSITQNIRSEPRLHNQLQHLLLQVLRRALGCGKRGLNRADNLEGIVDHQCRHGDGFAKSPRRLTECELGTAFQFPSILFAEPRPDDVPLAADNIRCDNFGNEVHELELEFTHPKWLGPEPKASMEPVHKVLQADFPVNFLLVGAGGSDGIVTYASALGGLRLLGLRIVLESALENVQLAFLDLWGHVARFYNVSFLVYVSSILLR